MEAPLEPAPALSDVSGELARWDVSIVRRRATIGSSSPNRGTTNWGSAPNRTSLRPASNATLDIDPGPHVGMDPQVQVKIDIENDLRRTRESGGTGRRAGLRIR